MSCTLFRLTQFILVLFLTVAVAGCQFQTTPSTVDTEPAKTAQKKSKKAKKKSTEKQKTVVRPGPALERAEIEKIICKGRKQCRTTRVWDVSTDTEKQPMQIVIVTTDPKLTEKMEKDSGYLTSNEDRVICEPLEYWFVRPTLIHNNTPETQPILITRGCGGFQQDASDISPADIPDADQPGRFTIKKAPRGDVPYYVHTTVELPSLQIIQERKGFYNHERHDFYGDEWDWQTMSGTYSGYDPRCDTEPAKQSDGENFSSQPIMIASLPKAFREGGWKGTALASCSTDVTSQGNVSRNVENTGYVVHGEPTKTDETGFKVVMASPTEIYVEVSDPKLVRNADNILHTDHLEIWMRTRFDCAKPYKNLYQWGVTLDGKVHNLYGKHPKPPTAQTSIRAPHDGKQIVRFKLSIPAQYDGLTIAYSDSDDGRSQKRLIATSDLKYRDQFSIGVTKKIPASRGTCQVKAKKLEYIPKLQKLDGPVIP